MFLKSKKIFILKLLLIFVSPFALSTENISTIPKVELIKPQVKNVELAIEGFGHVIARENVIISAQVDSIAITELLVEVGDQIKKGDRLAILDTESITVELKRYQALLDSAQASLSQAKIEVSSARSLSQKGGISIHDINTALLNEKIALAAVQVAQTEIAEKKLLLNKAKIVSPDDGIIVSRQSNVGQVTSVDTELYTLQRHGKVEWLAEVNADEVNRIIIGDKVRIFNKDHHEVVTGTVRRIAPLIDPLTNRAKVYVTINSRDFKVGMFITGKIITDINKVALLPISALAFEGNDSYIYILNSDSSTCMKKRVELGHQYDNMIEIKGTDITDNLQVILRGAAFLNDGDKVNVVVGGIK